MNISFIENMLYKTATWGHNKTKQTYMYHKSTSIRHFEQCDQ